MFPMLFEWNFLNTEPYKAGNFKNATPATVFIQFRPIFWGHWLPGRSTYCYFLLAIDQVLKLLWHCEILTCWISWKELTVERNGCKLGTRGPRNRIAWSETDEWIFLNTEPYRAGNFKNATPATVFIQFRPIFWGHWLPGRSTYCYFLLAIDQVLKLLWHCEILTCWISWKELTVERNGCKLGTRGPRNRICRELFHGWFFKFTLRSYRARCKISYTKTFQRPPLPQF